jgi:hypothetical protein
MYAGIMNDALSNLDSVNGQLDQLNKKKLLGNNVQQYQQALSGGQDKLLQEMKDSGNEDAYNNMYMRKMQLQQQQQPTMMDRLRGMFGGQ